MHGAVHGARLAVHVVRPFAGPVRGISLKLQEEERERRMEFVPERSEVPELVAGPGRCRRSERAVGHVPRSGALAPFGS